MDAPLPLTDGPWMPRPPHPAVSRLKRVGRFLLITAVVLGLVLLFHRPVLIGYARYFEVNDPTPSDYIVLLMGGPDHRPARVAELYREGLAPHVLYATSGMAISEVAKEDQATKDVLRKGGVPDSAITILPERVTSTRDEAIAVRRFLQTHPARKILVVTSAFHTRRSRWLFRKVLADMPVEVNTAAAYSPEMDRENWYKNDEGLIGYFIESVKLLVYWIRY